MTKLFQDTNVKIAFHTWKTTEIFKTQTTINKHSDSNEWVHQLQHLNCSLRYTEQDDTKYKKHIQAV
jgi:hypothetical protein